MKDTLSSLLSSVTLAALLLYGAPGQAQTIPSLDPQESAFLSLINAYRSQNGAGPLQLSAALVNSSKWMSNDMATKNYFSHTDSLGRDPGARMAAFGYPYLPWGENIAAGNSDAQSTLNQWIGACDPDASGNCTWAHRNNMLNPSFVVIGIGRAAGGTYGWYWTTDFGGVVDQPQNTAPTITSFRASPTAITAGQSASLAWSVSGATSLTLSNGIGSVTGSTSVSVSPSSTTSYTLTASNSSGSTTATATVTVNPASVQPPTAPSITSAVARSATEIDLTWTASSDSLGISGYQVIRNGAAVANVSGSVLSWADTGVTGATTYSYVVKAFDSAGNYSAASGAVQATTPSSSGASTGLGFVPVTPCRLVDTRASSGMPAAFEAPSLSGGQSRNFPIPSSTCGIPATASVYSLNVTVVPKAGLAYLSIWPTGQSQPVVSTLNSPNGQIVANAAIVPAGADGAISVFVSDSTDVIIDIDGYFKTPAATTLAFYPVAPCRVADTRSGSGFSGSFGAPALVAGQTRAFSVLSSSCGIPASAQAYSLNLTAVPPAPLGYVSVWPAGQSKPGVSTINSPDGSIVANAAIVPGGGSGAIDVFASDNTDLIVDINGYFAPAGGPGALYLYPVAPCRVADTRSSTGFTDAFGAPALIASVRRDFPISSSACGAPASAQAYSLNMTVVPSDPLEYLTAWPAGQSQPLASTLNSPNGGIVANAAIVPAGAGGAISVLAPESTNLIIDIDAYFAP